MEIVQIAILSIVQGITEFLPISSSAHLILVPQLTGWPDQGLSLDVAMHIGTLAAVVVYFRGEVGRIAMGAGNWLRGRPDPDSRLFLQLIIGTIPVVVTGFILADQIAHYWRNPLLIVATTIGFGLLLLFADQRSRLVKDLRQMSLTDALLIGFAQALALVPGVSRSGITMTAALLLSFNRAEAARFSLLLSIPTTFAAGVLGGIDIYRSADSALQADAGIAAVLSFFAGLLAIAGLMAWLKRASFIPFVVYRILLGSCLLLWILTGT